MLNYISSSVPALIHALTLYHFYRPRLSAAPPQLSVDFASWAQDESQSTRLIWFFGCDSNCFGQAQHSRLCQRSFGWATIQKVVSWKHSRTERHGDRGIQHRGTTRPVNRLSSSAAGSGRFIRHMSDTQTASKLLSQATGEVKWVEQSQQHFSYCRCQSRKHLWIVKRSDSCRIILFKIVNSRVSA